MKSPEFNFFALMITRNEPFKPYCLIEKNDDTNTYALMLSFLPSWDTIDKDLIVPGSELIFVVDRLVCGRISYTLQIRIYVWFTHQGCEFHNAIVSSKSSRRHQIQHCGIWKFFSIFISFRKPSIQ